MKFIEEFIRIKNEAKLGWNKIEEISGVSNATVRGWAKHKYAPNIYNFQAVLNALGYELVIRRKK